MAAPKYGFTKERFAVGVTLPRIPTGRYGWNQAKFADRQRAAYVEAVGKKPVELTGIAAAQFAWPKGKRSGMTVEMLASVNPFATEMPYAEAA